MRSALLALLLLTPLAHGQPAAPPPLPRSAAPIVESVRFEGVPAHRVPALRARIDYPDDAPLDDARVESARLQLLETGLYERVTARLERGAERGRVVLVFALDRRTTFSLDAFHLGHGRPTLLWGGAEVSDLDPFGVGLAVGVGAVTSGEQTAGRLRFGLADAMFERIDVGVGVYGLDGQEPFVGPQGQQLDGREVEHISVPYVRAGGDLTVGYEVRPLTRVHLGLRLEYFEADLPGAATQTDIDGERRAFEFDAPAGDPLLGRLTAGIEYDSRDDPAFPARGVRTSLLVRAGHAGEAWGGALAGVEGYFALPLGHVLRLDAKAGALTAGTPFFERFFIGDLHPYIPARALGLNFAQRRGPNLIDGTITEQRYETLTGRVGFEYRIPVGGGPRREPYGVEFFIGSALLSLGSPGGLDDTDFADRDPFPFDLAVDVGLRLETEIGVMGLSIGNLFLLVDP